jgi:CYTH domain-containing protein
MAVERRFLIAPSLVRLLMRESRHTDRIVEGYFASPEDQTCLVRVEREQAALVLAKRGEDGLVAEEPAVIPHSQAEALMEAAAGRVAFDRMIVPVGGNRVAVLEHFLVPSGVDVLTMPVEDLSDPPAWFGPEITHRAEFDTSSLALNGRPAVREIEITNQALEALLDTLEGHTPWSSAPGQAAPTDSEPPTSKQDGPADIASAASSVEERTATTVYEQVEQRVRRVADRSDITPKHLRRLEKEARRPIFRNNVGEEDKVTVGTARAFSSRHLPPN